MSSRLLMLTDGSFDCDSGFGDLSQACINLGVGAVSKGGM